MPRIPELSPDRLTAEQRAVYDAIVAGPRGKVAGPLRVWLQSPKLAARAQELGAFCRYGTSLPKTLSELAILVTGAFWKAGYEWFVHAPEAIKAGIDAAAVEAIRAGKKPKLTRGDQAAVYDFARELLETQGVSDATYRRTVDEIGDVGVVELVGILGYYGLVSMTIRAFGVAVPAGEAEPFPND
jgi:4-carboxymuconolactone decarboxylase